MSRKETHRPFLYGLPSRRPADHLVTIIEVAEWQRLGLNQRRHVTAGAPSNSIGSSLNSGSKVTAVRLWKTQPEAVASRNCHPLAPGLACCQQCRC